MKPILLAAMLAFAATAVSAHEYKAGSLEIKHPWSRATPKGATVAGGYLKIINTGTTPDRLIGGSTVAAGKFEIHEMSMDNGVMKMRLLANGVEIKPGQTVEFKPGSYHLMFVGITQPFGAGQAGEGHAGIREGRQGRRRIRRRGHRRHAQGRAQRPPRSLTLRLVAALHGPAAQARG